MRYNLTTPCAECPFLKGSGFTWASLHRHAAGEYEPRSDKTPHCAGALIFLEKQDKPNQMMRICERIGLYDRTKLDMDANVGSKPSDYGRRLRG
jgi:hypothetical protein